MPVHGAEFQGTTARIIIILSIVACFMSMTAVISVLTWWNLHVSKNRRQFRHRLIIYLLFCDLFKAVMLVIHPCLNFTYEKRMDTYPYSSPICNGLGFMTTYALANVDFANLCLALNTLISVFSKENGPKLRILRRALYIAVALIPIICASLGMIPHKNFGTGYTYFASSCYLRFAPLWYRVVLVWMPRLSIMLTIAVVYFAIYIRLRNHIRHLEQSFECVDTYVDLETKLNTEIYGPANRLQQAIRHIALRLPGLGFLMRYGRKPLSEPSVADDCSTATRCASPHTDILRLRDIMRSDNFRRFQQSRALMERNVNMMFIYPVVYFFIWMFPLAEDGMGLHYGLRSTPPPWLSVVALFMRSIEGFVDSVVFLAKEMVPYDHASLSSPGRRQSDPVSKNKNSSVPSTYRNSLTTLRNANVACDNYLDTDELIAEGILNQESLISREKTSPSTSHFSGSASDTTDRNGKKPVQELSENFSVESSRQSAGRSSNIWKIWSNSNSFTTSKTRLGSKEVLPVTGDSEIDLFDVLRQGPQESKQQNSAYSDLMTSFTTENA